MSKEAMKLALEALIAASGHVNNEVFAKVMMARDAINEALREALAEQPAQQEPVAWRDHVEQRLLTWRQSFVNKSGDQLALGDFMDKQSLDDLIDFVCDEYTSPPASKPWVGLTDEEIRDWWRIENGLEDCDMAKLVDFTLAVRAIEAKLKEKNT